MSAVVTFDDMQRRLYQSDLESGLNNSARSKHRTVSYVFLTAAICFILWSVIGIFTSAPFLLWLIVLSGWIVSLALHEYGHAVVAYRGGDITVLEKGYLSLNFLLYIDPIMSLLLPVAMLTLGGIPLPGGSVVVNTSNLRSAHWDAATSLAGPCMNLLFGAICRLALATFAFFTRITLGENYLYHGCTGMAWTVLIYIQGVAAILNLLPLPPLDGWGIISPYLSPSCFLKSWLNRSHWNYKTMSLITFGLIFVGGTITPIIDLLYRPLGFMYQLDRSLLASGFAAFFGAFHFT